MRHNLIAAALVATLFGVPSAAFAEGCLRGVRFHQTWREEAANSKLIVYGTVANPRGKPGAGTTDILISAVIKPHRLLGNRKVLRMDRFVQIDPQKHVRRLIFCDVTKDRIDPYRGIEVGPAAINYLTGLLLLEAKDDTQRLHHCFQFLEHPDPDVAADAFQEFLKTPGRELAIASRKLSPQKVVGWLKDPKTLASRLGIYGALLGYCGGKGDALLLRALAEKRGKRDFPMQMDGILFGYTLLAPREGWAYTCKLLANRSNEFVLRYAALRAVRYFHHTRPDIIARKDILEAMKSSLLHEDMNDLAIEDLRRWRCWELTARILPLYGKPSKGVPVLRRAILRYAMQCPGSEAAAFLADRRKAEPDFVAESVEVVKQEQAQR
jgi:hypothetical protein